jgi:hypothetical protein
VANERELIGLVQAVRHWRPYLWGCCFLVRTDHFSLKFLLDQRLSTVPQHQWINKLFGFDFAVEYCPGRLNTVADALSHRDSDASANALLPSFRFLDDIRVATAPSRTTTASSSSSRTESPDAQQRASCFIGR